MRVTTANAPDSTNCSTLVHLQRHDPAANCITAQAIDAVATAPLIDGTHRGASPRRVARETVRGEHFVDPAFGQSQIEPGIDEGEPRSITG